MVEWERGTPACSSFQACSAELRKVIGPVSLGHLLSWSQDSAPCPRTLFHVQLPLIGETHTLATFIDSKADISLIDEELADQPGV